MKDINRLYALQNLSDFMVYNDPNISLKIYFIFTSRPGRVCLQLSEQNQLFFFLSLSHYSLD